MRIRIDELKLLIKQIINENSNDGQNIFRTRRTPDERKRNYKIAIYHQIKAYIKGGCQGDLDLSETPIEVLPNGLKRVGGNLFLSRCTSLVSLPNDLSVDGNLDLGGCKSLVNLPDGLSVSGYLYLNYCTSLVSLPDGLSVGSGLILNSCTSLVSLPNDLSVGGFLDLYGCDSLVSLPNRLSVGGSLNLCGTPLSKRYSEEEIRKIIEDKGGNIKAKIYLK
jgi:hypothetical protein